MDELFGIFGQGGWVMWALLGTSLVAWALIVFKAIELLGEGASARKVAPVLGRLHEGRRLEAMELCQRHDGCVARVLLAAISAGGQSRDLHKRHLAPLLEGESLDLRRHLSLIAQLAVVAPLLGLLGTVLGMIDTFTAITAHGVDDAASLAAGVSKALITTEAGLLVAVPILLLHGYLSSRAQQLIDTATLYAKKVQNMAHADRG